ncbi:MAG: chromosomal replication initiator DnaA, partial [Clostridiaceae bacterium]|nr:chromosomal replication initiator DnaA [Clostridiaceae bacterium]
MTNFKTTQCGIFKLAKKIVEAEIGYSRETIEKLLKRFIDYGKIAYCEETKELMILNWMKYNFSSSKNTIACINKELKEIKHKEFINILYK